MGKTNAVYHYCSLETFEQIIINKTFRVSDVDKMNDYMERYWAIEVLLNMLQDVLNDKGYSINLDEVYYYDDKSESHKIYLANEVKHRIDFYTPILVTCFSKEKDLLSQWRGYGDDGKGISLGINLDLLENLEHEEFMIVDEVEYAEKKYSYVMLDLIEECIEYIEKLEKQSIIGQLINDSDKFFYEEFDSFIEVLCGKFITPSLLIKNPVFKEEKEVRVVYNPNLINLEFLDDDIHIQEAYEVKLKEKIKIKNFQINPIKIQVRSNKIISYCDIDFSKLIKKDIISEIVIGPKSKISEHDLKMLLLANDIDPNEVKICVSEASYR